MGADRGERVEREAITGIWGSKDRAPGGGSGAKPPEAKKLFVYFHTKRDQTFSS